MDAQEALDCVARPSICVECGGKVRLEFNPLDNYHHLVCDDCDVDVRWVSELTIYLIRHPDTGHDALEELDG